MILLRPYTIGTAAKLTLRKKGLRSFSGSAVPWAKFFARTNIGLGPRPTDGIMCPPNFSAKSVILLSTPQNLPHVIENAIALHQAKIQVVVAGVDRVVPNGVSNGVSELWLDEKVRVKRAVVTPKEPISPAPRESDGIHAVGAKVNWKNIEGSVTMGFGQYNVGMSLANTLFATNTPTTLFYFDSSGENMGQTLKELEVEVPQLEPGLTTAVFTDRWTPLTQEDVLHVTKCTGNLIKGINKQPASSFLENNKKLMDVASKSTKVYAKIHTETKTLRYEVIAGGGGWGAKADLLALSPEANVKVGDRVEFYMITPEDRYTKRHVDESMGSEDTETSIHFSSTVVSNQFLFESPLESTSYSSQVSSPQTIDHLFGGGSESGLTFNGVSHSSPGESVSIKFGH